jgi:hypothetical protein
MMMLSLTLELCLNIEADQLAMEYMVDDPTQRPVVAYFILANAQLIINDASVTLGRSCKPSVLRQVA